MTTVALRPLLRTTSSPAPSSLCRGLGPRTQTRNANLIPRPKRPYLLDQIIILSDGSSYKALTTSPRGVLRCTKDTRNNAMWNPSLSDLKNVEEDEAGKLRKFRARFGDGFEGVGGMADLLGGGQAPEGGDEKIAKKGDGKKKKK